MTMQKALQNGSQFWILVSLAVQVLMTVLILWRVCISDGPYPAVFTATVTCWVVLSFAGLACWVREHAC